MQRTRDGAFPMTWEESVRWLLDQPDQKELARACFYDGDAVQAGERFYQCAEWRAARRLLPRPRPGRNAALDLGAGRGIGAYALARDGWRVSALEPDPSPLVGAAAIRDMAARTGLDVSVHENWGETLPFPDARFDAVHARQVLHHAFDLRALARETFRVLKPGGALLATREHVISRPEDLAAFLAGHPLHRLYGGENAYLLEDYCAALKDAGFRLRKILGPWDSDVNLFPAAFARVREAALRERGWDGPLLRRLLPDWAVRRWGRKSALPGRLYSFLGVKP